MRNAAHKIGSAIQRVNDPNVIGIGIRATTFFSEKAVIGIGFLQDRIFSYIDTRLNPHKYLKYKWQGIQECQYGIFFILLSLLAKAVWPTLIPSTFIWIAVAGGLVLIVLGELKLAGASKQK